MSAEGLVEVVVRGIGIDLPTTVQGNEELETRFGLPSGWVEERTGIRSRRVTAPHDTTASLAARAVEAALTDAGLSVHDLDLLVVTTTTPEQLVPASSAFVAQLLGATCPAFDVSAACTGFAYAFVVANALLASGHLRRIAVVGAETFTRIVDDADRDTAILFGDGAGALVIESGPASGGLVWHSSSDAAISALQILAGGSRRPMDDTALAEGAQYLMMNGREVMRRAVPLLVGSIRQVLEEAGLTADDIDCFVPHQANGRILSNVARQVGIPMERTVVSLEEFGNTSAASVPLALHTARMSGLLRDGAVVLLSGFGAGMTVATTVFVWKSGADSPEPTVRGHAAERKNPEA
jgi:3-oxoacyl-[acyl-carrier-protein] synthase III